ncbi:MAG: Swt1 family HEPN domain-containing protein [Bacteroidetes bacterium]|nr:Swt1 family HEPN domain-containing protein [Bacteroidota bacterium]
MATTNYERVGKALELLKTGLGPFIERELKNKYADSAQQEATRYVNDDRIISGKPVLEWDVSALLKLMWESWNEVFKVTLGFTERSLVSELRDWRNKWAHQESFSSDDVYRVLDSASRLLAAVSAPEAEEIEKMKMELLRVRFDEQVRGEKRKAAASLIEGAATGALKPWREVVTPHADVASGRYQQAEFAADLWQVYLDEGSEEYRNPREFFRRTYLTESLKRLLVSSLQRLSGEAGDPVVQLQTNFGGGKTHSMLALYHLFSGTAAGEMPGVEGLLAESGVKKIPKANRVVLVGNRISPGNPSVKPDGTVVRTLWGELAYQLGGKRAFQRIAKDDEHATSPGDVLRTLLVEHGPSLVLIDEWVAYARQLHDESDLPAGSFGTQFTFAQLLTESAKAAKNCLLVISLPASDGGVSPYIQADDVEVGGIRGREALDRLRNVVGRVESSWRPATAEEGFEIVRRRLFEALPGSEAFKQRDITAQAFAEVYRTQAAEFPPECKNRDYEERIKAAYPIHPEIFDRLYTDWSTLAKFQRTRGVLRLMATVIHTLWEKGDKNPLILPCMIPIDDQRVQFELTRYLSDNWMPIIEKDVDGPNSMPLRIDSDLPNLGKLHATRRVARTIYLGSAPTAGASHRGLEDRRIRLGCVMPGESPAIFGDALRRLASTATFLYQDGSRFWYGTQPTVTKLAEDRAEQFKRDTDKVSHELESTLREDIRNKGDFSRVHPVPRSTADVPDDLDARLVVLPAEKPHSKDPKSAALTEAKSILEMRGTIPRTYRNTLVFLAADQARMQDLDEALRRYLAWKSIVEDKETLNLDPHQARQAETQKQAADAAVSAQIPEVYQWLLVPEQKTPQSQVEWQSIRLTNGGNALAVRASRKLRSSDILVTGLGSTILRKYLDEVPLWRGNHVPIKQLIEDFARYLYLPRLTGPEVLIQAIRDGVSFITWQTDTFAFAERFDETASRYVGLRAGQQLTLTLDSAGLLVRSDVARRQLDAEVPAAAAAATGAAAIAAGTDSSVPGKSEVEQTKAPPADLPHRFHGTVTLDPERVGRDAGRIAEEVISHLSGLLGANVRVTLEVEADIPTGASDQVVRTVTENCRTLKFGSHGFEKE